MSNKTHKTNSIKAAKVISMAALLFLFGGCGSTEKIGDNPARMLRSTEQAEALRQIHIVDTTLQLYTWDYTRDYHLDRLVENDVNSLAKFIFYLGRDDLHLLPGMAHLRSVVPGCSCFHIKTQKQEDIVGRNFDYISPRGVSDVIVIRTHPANGYKSMGLVSMSILNQPPHSLTDGRTDLSILMAAPYLVMDGINEKGFFIGVLYLDGEPTQQHDKQKHDIMTLTAIRLLLDKAATVDDAINILNQYNMFAGTSKGSYHFMVADTTGRQAVIEYINDGDLKSWRLTPVEAEYTTNFYLNDGWREIGHGYDRYDVMRQHIDKESIGDNETAMRLLQAVAQEPTKEKTSNTQWSAVYDLQKKCLQLCVGRHYDTVFKFELLRPTWP